MPQSVPVHPPRSRQRNHVMRSDPRKEGNEPPKPFCQAGTMVQVQSPPYICRMQKMPRLILPTGKNHRWVLRIYGVLALWMGIISVSGCGSEPKPVDGGPKLDTLAPEFSVMDSGGGIHHLQEYLGQPTALVFSVDECGHCEGLIQDLAKTQPADFPGKVVIFYQCRGKEEMAAMQDSLGLKFPVLLGDPHTYKQYNVKFTPMIVLLKPDGTVRRVTAAGSAEKLKKVMEG